MFSLTEARAVTTKPMIVRLTFASLLLAALSLPAAPFMRPAIAPGLRPRLIVPAEVTRILNHLHEVDLPAEWRGHNWIGNKGQGSCVHASLIHLLHWQGRHDLAEKWRATHGNGENYVEFPKKLQAEGIRFADTHSGDEAFLEWAIRTRRGAAVVVEGGAHMLNLVGLDSDHALLLDNNSPQRTQSVSRAKFLADWHASGGWAFTPLVGPPTAPDPWVTKPFPKRSQSP